MNSISIRISDQDVVDQLSRQAEQHKRSVEAEALELIRSGLGSTAPQDRLSVARRISAMTPRDRAQTDSTILVREDRDRDG